ncbi:MAG: DUF3568 family protein [Betaproteobacteria bacterium]|nr:DUF3568 family protein [Betaproteobacteria bacterium]
MLLVAGVAGLAGCEPLSITAFGVGASAGVTHTMGGMTYRTFTAPLTKVRGATMTALNRMGIKVASISKNEGGELIKANASGREIEIQLEPLTPNTTRMRTLARNGWFFDSATATEIILQTEKSMGNV